MILKIPKFSKHFLLFLSLAIYSVHISCALVAGQKQHSKEDLPIYTSQINIIKQGYTEVPSPYGPIPSVYFGYKRNRDPRLRGSTKNNKNIDILEYKMLKKEGGWNRQPYLVFSDDTFDGIVDRLFLDSNLDGSFDKIYDIASEGLLINEITFKKFKPWQRKQPIESPENGINLI